MMLRLAIAGASLMVIGACAFASGAMWQQERDHDIYQPQIDAVGGAFRRETARVEERELNQRFQMHEVEQRLAEANEKIADLREASGHQQARLMQATINVSTASCLMNRMMHAPKSPGVSADDLWKYATLECNGGVNASTKAKD